MDHRNGGTLFCLASFRQEPPSSTPENQNTIETNVPVKDDFDFAEALESIYPLMEIIFDYLNLEELQIASKVKESWKVTANTVLQKRIKPEWFTCLSDGARKFMNCSFSKKTYNNIGLGVVFYDFNRIDFSRYVCVHDNFKISRKTVLEYISDELVPKATDFCLISCPGVNTLFDCSTCLTADSLFGGLLIPAIPNIRTAMIRCNLYKNKNAEEILQSYLKPNETTRCLIIFCKRDLSRSLKKFIEIMVNNENPQTVACGGGIIKGIKTFQQLDKHDQKISKIHRDSDIFCIGFFQKDKCDFNAYSVVIKGDDLSKIEFEAELLQFKHKIRLRSRSVTFRICCAAKFKPNDEMSVFNSVFPGIPLLSFNADGEIGWNCYSNSFESEDETVSKKLKYNLPKLQHQWSTVLIVLTWG